MPYPDRHPYEVPLYSSSYTADFTLDAGLARQRHLNNLRLITILGLAGLLAAAFAAVLVALLA
jgi:hypothetical protein